MRTFIAIDLPKEIRDYLTQLQDKLKTCNADVKWVKPENIHLTLKFLGEVNEDKLEKIKKILEKTGQKQKTFFLRLSGAGAFPSIKSPRVIWISVDKGDRETREIAAFLEEEIQKLGIPKEERPFSSHITLGRIKSGLNRQELAKNLEGLSGTKGVKNPEFLVKEIALYKSTLSLKGPTYEAIKTANLKIT